MTEARIVKSTADLTPAGLAGYAKSLGPIIGAIGAALAAIVPYLDPDSDWARWVGIGIAVCGVIATILIPNPVEPVTVVDGTPGPGVITGVVPPPAPPNG